MTAQKRQETIDDMVIDADAGAAFRGFLRNAVCEAIDAAVEQHGTGKLLDEDLPDLFRAIDALAERLTLRGLGQ